jgi:hypothetical protein
MRLRTLKTKELGSINRNHQTLSFFSLFLASRHDRLSEYSLSGQSLQGFGEPRVGPQRALHFYWLMEFIPQFHCVSSFNPEKLHQVPSFLFFGWLPDSSPKGWP